MPANEDSSGYIDDAPQSDESEEHGESLERWEDVTDAVADEALALAECLGKPKEFFAVNSIDPSVGEKRQFEEMNDDLIAEAMFWQEIL